MPYNIFGPVPSRRLGRSLGVDLVPYKTCSFDCVYCELGPTTCHTKERNSYGDIDKICKELQERLHKLKGEVDYVTLAGSGEPTLNKNLGPLIERIKGITGCPIAILTNSSLLMDPYVRKELSLLDLIVPSLDAVTEDVFKRINRPVEGIEIEEIIEGLIDLRGEFTGQIWLEILVCKGINDSKAELDKIKGKMGFINPDRIQINTVFRPPTLEDIMPVSTDRLKEIEAYMGPRAQAVGRADIDSHRTINSRSVKTRALMLLKRRPCTIQDIADSLCMARLEVIKLMDGMMEKKEVTKVSHQGSVYYRANMPSTD